MDTFVTTVATLFFAAILALLAAVPGGAAFMLLMGVLHHEISAAVPAIGFASAYPIMLFGSWTFSALGSTTSVRVND